MGYHYQDPTANMALGNINREFSRLEKKAKALKKRQSEGLLSDEALKKARKQYKGIYIHVLDNILKDNG